MLRFCDKEVCCVSYEELNRRMLLTWFLQGNMDEMICIFNSDGTYRGRITYRSMLNCEHAEDAVMEDYAVLDRDFWKYAREFFACHEQNFGEHMLLPVLDAQKRLISFAYEDLEANRELRMLRELEELPGAVTFADIYPQYDCVKICGCNELALRFAMYLREHNICVETDGELWDEFFDDGEKAEVPDYKRLVIYAEGVYERSADTWVGNLLRSVSPEFECIDCIYEANWKAGIVRDTDMDLAGLLNYLRDAKKEIAILGADVKAQNVYDYLLGKGIKARYFVSGIREDRQHLLFGKKVLESTAVWKLQDKLILLDCREENSALGIPILEAYDYLGFRRNRDLYFLKDYVEVPYNNLRNALKDAIMSCGNNKETLNNQRILFVGDILLCNRVACYLRENIEVREMYFADVLGESTSGIFENSILRQINLEEIDNNVICLIVMPGVVGGAEIVSAGKERKKDVVRTLKENGICNYTDYFSFPQVFIALERDMAERGFKKEQFRPKKIILGVIEAYSGNFFVKGLLDNHPSILMISNPDFFNNNLFWLCVQLAGIPSESMITLFQHIYHSQGEMQLHDMEKFEEKLAELLKPGGVYTSQELFVILTTAYVYMYGREIHDIGNMVVYWEPHSMGCDIVEAFTEWFGMENGLCSILNVVRNICMVKGSFLKGRLLFGWKGGGTLIDNVIDADTPKKKREYIERYVVRFEDLKLKPREELSGLCGKWKIPWSETLMRTTEFGLVRQYDNGHEILQDFDLTPVYNNYEEYFSSFDRFRITLICARWQKKYGYPYVELSDFTRRELQEMFLKEFRFEKELPYSGQKQKQDSRIQDREKIREQLWEVRKQEMLEKCGREPILSVIVPVYNAEQYLEKCLDSIVNQTFRDMEILVVDDGSTDGSLEICRAFSRADSRIKVISKENGGLIRARKTGLAAAAGKLIGFVDSDDWIEAGMYEELVQCMTGTGCDLVSSGTIREYQVSGESMVLHDHYQEKLYRDLESDIYPTMLRDERYKDYGLYCNLVSKVFKKSLLDKVYENINEDVFYGEDVLACYPYCLLCESIYILHKAFYHYNIRGGSMCSTPDQRLLQNNYLLYTGLRDIFRKADNPLPLLRQLKGYMIYIEKHCMTLLYHISPETWDTWRFSYSDDLFEKKFVVYGAGVCGQAFYRFLCEKGKEKNMVHWVDKRADERAKDCLYPVQFPDVLKMTDWEILFIAVEHEDLAGQIADEIQDMYHIEKKRLYWSKAEHQRN